MRRATLALVAGGFLASASSSVFESTWVDEIQASFPSTDAIDGSSSQCVISETEACDISGMEKDATTMVYPGGATRCIYSTSTDFAFQVLRLFVGPLDLKP